MLLICQSLRPRGVDTPPGAGCPHPGAKARPGQNEAISADPSGCPGPLVHAGLLRPSGWGWVVVVVRNGDILGRVILEK